MLTETVLGYHVIVFLILAALLIARIVLSFYNWWVLRSLRERMDELEAEK